MKRISLEEWFCTLEPSDFPDNNDCVSTYKIIRQYMNEEIHSEIKAIVAILIPDMYLNEHGEKHINKVNDKASELLKFDSSHLSPYEFFFLFLAIQIHDAGHIINGRHEHAKNARVIINKFGKELLSSVEKIFISQIAKAHSGKDDPIGQLNEEQFISNQKINLKKIAAIVRLADELADDTTRASSFLVDNKLIPENSKIFHVYSQCLDSCTVDSNQIRMSFYLSEEHLVQTYTLGDKSVFLLDEIYDRTLKTFTESIYCNRFLPEDLRIKSINVEIFIDYEDNSIIPKKIDYRLEEIGYPNSNHENIFQICDTLKNNDGNQLTGKYYNDLISKLSQTNE